MLKTTAPEMSGDVKKDVDALYDAYISLTRKLEYEMTHVDDQNTSFTGNLSLNSDYMFVQLRRGRYIGK